MFSFTFKGKIIIANLINLLSNEWSLTYLNIVAGYKIYSFNHRFKLNKKFTKCKCLFYPGSVNPN